MPAEREFPVYGDNGVRGVLYAPARFLDKATQRRVRFEDGSEEWIPASALEARPDGSFYIRTATPRTEPASEPAPPPAAQAPPVAAAPPIEPIIAPGVHPGEALFREDFDIQRIPVGRLLDGPVEARQEGDSWIVPVTEEVLVLEKRLLLKEELHIVRRREQVTDSKPIRREDIDARR